MLAAIALAGCASSAESLQRLLTEEHYVEAYALLVEEGVGGMETGDAEAEALELRARYTDQIESTTVSLVDRLLNEGEAHAALTAVRERGALCPWSDTIRTQIDRCEVCVRRIQETEARWSGRISASSGSPETVRAFLKEIEPHRPWILGSTSLRSLEQAAADSMIQGWARSIAAASGRLSSSEFQAMQADLEMVGLAPTALEDVKAPLLLLARLPSAANLETRLGADAIEALRTARETLAGSGRTTTRTRLEPCASAAWKAVHDWVNSEFTIVIAHESVTFEALSEAEEWLTHVAVAGSMRQALATAHVNRAAHWAPHGIASAFSLLHLERARSLAKSEDVGAWHAVQQLANATFAATPAPVVHLEVELGPKVLPEVRGLVATSLVIGLGAHPDTPCRVAFERSDNSMPSLTLAVEQADLETDIGDLSTVTSRHFSHFEEVPNPEKEALRSQLDYAEFSVKSKQRAYDWAVSSHNAYPTQFTLNNVNLAYSAYQYAVNHYNSLVDRFNWTPSTISNAVYLPYSFRQGYIRFGWILSGEATTNQGQRTRLAAESVARDFVRLGNRGTDANEAYRQADDLDIDVSPGAAIDHMERVLAELKADLYPVLAQQLLADTANGLEAEERAILGWLLHPWGSDPGQADRLGVPEWAKEASRGLRLEQPATPPPSIAVNPSEQPYSAPLDAEVAAAVLGSYVCQLTSSAKERMATGTAALIGPEGLLLTCAHVLIGSNVRVEFLQGPWSGSYSVEVLFVNAERDVALIRAVGLQNASWANVRMESTTAAGEQIVAIGNPGMDIGGTNRGGISQGIVSNARLERGQSHYLAADISIAQGSSGGPLFSLKTGELVGVVQLVATSPGFPVAPDQVAATGYLCLAAPSQALPTWLGLTGVK